ncbi:MAG: hypothetical protein R3A51_06550 [Nannocystaceae bacterium]|nr:hypothetical protein [Myxococcales bacterium]
MFKFGSEAIAAPQFIPEESTREWIAAALRDIVATLGAVAREPRTIADPPARGVSQPRDLDSLFDFICATQEHIGQDELEFTLTEMQPGKPPVPEGFMPLGDPLGHLIHSFRNDAGAYVLLVVPQIFKAPPLVLGGVARELGRMGLSEAGGHRGPLADVDEEAAAELAGIALGMGVWVANGAYMFENSCCGGGCGLDLTSVAVSLSIPEVCFALALDAQRKGISRRHIARLLEPTQKAAFKKNWSDAGKVAPALAAGAAQAALDA